MTKGIMMYAHNNEQVDYGLIALCNALMIKHHLKNNQTCLITDNGTIDWLRESRGDFVKKAFDHVIVQNDENYTTDISKKMFYDTLSTSHELPWYNADRIDSYNLTPFDQTVIVDCDYFIMDKTLDLVWDGIDDIMINKKAISLDHKPLYDEHRWLETTSIEMYWATCIYFRKSKIASDFFELVRHIKTNYKYYSMVYGFPLTLYRNDYIFSIAVHMMNGFRRTGDIGSLPSPFLLTSFEKDELIGVPAIGEMQFLINSSEERWKFRLGKVKDVSVHILNKFSITRNADRIIEIYG